MSVEAATAASLTVKDTTKVHPFRNMTETQSDHNFNSLISIKTGKTRAIRG